MKALLTPVCLAALDRVGDRGKAARDEGMKMLFDSAVDKVREGLTSLEAALSVTMAEEE